ncbi:hypothetical protein GCM10027217_24770 [Pseudomaricurvus hydrocarbonicus]
MIKVVKGSLKIGLSGGQFLWLILRIVNEAVMPLFYYCKHTIGIGIHSPRERHQKACVIL